MKIILTGASGQLGQAIFRLYSERDFIELVRFHHEEDLDITDENAVIEKIGRIKDADFLIHAAAYTNVDGAETNPDLVFAVNAQGTRNVALACQVNGAIPLYLSTDYVFDGQSERPYIEDDPPNPVNVYGRSKLAGEEHVKTLLNRYFIVRTSWLFGLEGNNFVHWVCEKIKKQETLSIVTDHFGSPTFADDLARGLLDIIQNGVYGIYHYTNSGHTSWYDWAAYILSELGKSGVNLKRTSWSELGLPAPRPHNSVLDNRNCRLNNLPPPRTWQEATTCFLNQIS